MALGITAQFIILQYTELVASIGKDFATKGRFCPNMSTVLAALK